MATFEQKRAWGRKATKLYTLRHPEKAKEARRKWVLKNRERLNEYQEKWRQAHPSYMKLADAKYRKAHLLERRVKEAQKTRRRRKVEGSFTVEQWEAKKVEFKHRCPACGTRENEKMLTVDHIVPTIKGGTNDISNIQPLCATCNFRKQTKVIAYTPWQS